SIGADPDIQEEIGGVPSCSVHQDRREHVRVVAREGSVCTVKQPDVVPSPGVAEPHNGGSRLEDHLVLDEGGRIPFGVLEQGDHVVVMLVDDRLFEDVQTVRGAPVMEPDDAPDQRSGPLERVFFRSCASTTAMAVRWRMSAAVLPRCSTWTGLAIPRRTGPMASAPPMLASSL